MSWRTSRSARILKPTRSSTKSITTRSSYFPEVVVWWPNLCSSVTRKGKEPRVVPRVGTALPGAQDNLLPVKSHQITRAESLSTDHTASSEAASGSATLLQGKKFKFLVRIWLNTGTYWFPEYELKNFKTPVSSYLN